MYDIKLTNYVPEPKPATSDRIIAAHYYAAWKKGSAGIHNGFDDLHDYPERTPLMGYYDEENPAVCDWEIKWAVEHGINCFIHCWYRKMDNMGKHVTVNDLRCGHGLHEALFYARYQKFMKFAIMFENSPRWGTTDAKDIIEHLMPFWIENYFKRDNYLKIDNKPVLFIYFQNRLSEVFPNPEDQKRVFDSCREYAIKQGFDGMIFGLCNSSTEREKYEDSIARGYDFRLVLRGMKEISDGLPDGAWAKRIMMIDNWNEWDEEGYYVRSFSHGKPIGSSTCEKGAKIYANPQSWSIMSGVCPEERLQSVMDAVDKYIDTPVGCMVNYPAYTEADPALGRISFQYPGTNENGAIYAHATSFKMYADCMIGLGDRGYRSYLQLLPSNPDNPPEVSDTVPYAISNCCATADICYGKSSALPFGTGTQAWLFRTVIEGFLGIRFDYGGFKIEPAFPSTWGNASLTLERYGTIYNFAINNNNTGTKKVYVNDKLIENSFVPFYEDETVKIRVEL